MIKLSGLELVLFDFDDTLCIHEWHGDSPEERLTYNKRVLTDGVGAWRYLRPNRHMCEFMKMCSDAKLRMGLISATISYAHMEGKAEWVKKTYGYKLENYCVGSPEDKLAMVIALSEAWNIPRSKILIVDDYWKVLESAANAGFMAASPMEVVNFIEAED